LLRASEQSRPVHPPVRGIPNRHRSTWDPVIRFAQGYLLQNTGFTDDFLQGSGRSPNALTCVADRGPRIMEGHSANAILFLFNDLPAFDFLLLRTQLELLSGNIAWLYTID
jgi:hypothetical protein